jgi:hypothetical protein
MVAALLVYHWGRRETCFDLAAHAVQQQQVATLMYGPDDAAGWSCKLHASMWPACAAMTLPLHLNVDEAQRH